MPFRFLIAALASVCALPAFAADLDGRWLMKLTGPRGRDINIILDLKVDGETVTGQIMGGPPSGETAPLENGKLVGDQLSFNTSGNAHTPDGPKRITVAWTAKVEGEQLKEGTHLGPAPPGRPPVKMTWVATKKK